MTLPKPPAEVPRETSMDHLAPKFRDKVELVLAGMRRIGFDPIVAETLRDDVRQGFLNGFGREYDDGRDCHTFCHC